MVPCARVTVEAGRRPIRSAARHSRLESAASRSSPNRSHQLFWLLKKASNLTALPSGSSATCCLPTMYFFALCATQGLLRPDGRHLYRALRPVVSLSSHWLAPKSSGAVHRVSRRVDPVVVAVRRRVVPSHTFFADQRAQGRRPSGPPPTSGQVAVPVRSVWVLPDRTWRSVWPCGTSHVRRASHSCAVMVPLANSNGSASWLTSTVPFRQAISRFLRRRSSVSTAHSPA